MYDNKNLARILFENRMSKDYSTQEGKRRILAQNGINVAKRTFAANAKEINSHISHLHDQESATIAGKVSEAGLETLFSKVEYITGLRRIWDSAKSNRDKLQAGKQAAEFFGWKPKESDIFKPGGNVKLEGKTIVITQRYKDLV